MIDLPNTPKKLKAKMARFHTQSDTAKAGDWLNRAVAASQDKVTAQMIKLTPALAEVLINRNEGNRKVREQRVTDIARDITNGAYKINGESIIVAKDGHLNDGQHRCQAVILAGKPIHTLITIGVERETQDTVDHGTSRTPGDDLALNGYNNTARLAAAARFLWQWRKFGEIRGQNHSMPTRMELLKVVQENPGLQHALTVVDIGRTARATAIASPAILAFCYFAFKTVAHSEDVTYFFDALIEGANLERGDPILNLRNRLIAERGGSLNTAGKIYLIFQAWNAHRKGEKRTMFKIGKGELPLIEA